MATVTRCVGPVRDVEPDGTVGVDEDGAKAEDEQLEGDDSAEYGGADGAGGAAAPARASTRSRQVHRHASQPIGPAGADMIQYVPKEMTNADQEENEEEAR